MEKFTEFNEEWYSRMSHRRSRGIRRLLQVLFLEKHTHTHTLSENRVHLVTVLGIYARVSFEVCADDAEEINYAKT